MRALLLAALLSVPALGAQRGPSGLQPIPALPPSAASPAPRFTVEFHASVLELTKEKGGARWSEHDWQRLRSEIRQFAAGAPSAAEPARFGAAVEAGVWKFKWGGYRVFFHPDPGRGITLLDVRRKADLVAEGEGAFYDALARRLKSLEGRLLLDREADRLSRLMDGGR